MTALLSAGTLQPDTTAAEELPAGGAEALWLIGGGVLALIVLGFILTRRSGVKTAEPMHHPDPSRPDDEHVEPLL